MKKLLTLLLVFSFAFSFSAVKYVPEKKAENFLIEKSIVKADVVSVKLETVYNSLVSRENRMQSDYFFQHRFNQNQSLVYKKTKFVCSNQNYNYTFITMLPDKLSYR